MMKKLLLSFLLFVPLISNSQSKLKGMIEVKENLYVDDTEITNNEYRQFLNSLKSQNRMEEFQKYQPDTTVWMTLQTTGAEPLMNNYFSHPAFDDYPVVGISYESAIAFCRWRSFEMAKVGINVLFNLPSKTEWEEIAKAQNPDALYGGGWQEVKDAQKGKKEYNHYLFNFKPSPSNFIQDGFMYCNEVKAYSPDKGGVYGMAGNVSEMLLEKGIAKGGSWFWDESVARIAHDESYTKPQPWIGFRCIARFEK